MESDDHPGATACLEIRRDLLGDPWRPFEPSTVDARAIARFARPIADACAGTLATAMLDPHRPR